MDVGKAVVGLPLLLVSGACLAQALGQSFPSSPSSPIPVEALPPLQPDCDELISIASQPSIEPLQSMLRSQSNLPNVLRLILHYKIDADGVPIDVSILQSSQNRALDKVAVAWGGGVRFSGAPGCDAREGVLPVVLAP